MDPFFGSGTTAIVAMALNRQYVGIELSPDYCKMALARIERNKIKSEVVTNKTALLF